MSDAEYEALSNELRQILRPGSFSQHEEFIDRVRASSLTADQVARLRDSFIQGQPGTPAGQRYETVRLKLQGVYESRCRQEDAHVQSRFVSLVRDHPLGAMLAFVATNVVAAFISLMIGIAFAQPLSDWWRDIRGCSHAEGQVAPQKPG